MNQQAPATESKINPAAVERLAVRSAGLLWDLSVAEAELDRLRTENSNLHKQLGELLETMSDGPDPTHVEEPAGSQNGTQGLPDTFKGGEGDG